MARSSRPSRSVARPPPATSPWVWVGAGVALLGAGYLVVRAQAPTGLGGAVGVGGAATSTAVQGAQRALLAQHYHLGPAGVDGKLGGTGSYTRRALASFQSAHGLPATGELTPPTLSALGVVS